MSFWNSLTYHQRNRWDKMSPKNQKLLEVGHRLKAARSHLRSAEQEMREATEEYNELTGHHLPLPSSRLKRTGS